MIKVVLLGSGNIAGFLFEAFSTSENVQVVQVYNHAVKSLSRFESQVKTTTSLENLEMADVYLIAVKDDAIAQLAQNLKNKNGLVVHTSGAMHMDSLSGCEQRGVFYPLQTFSQNKEVGNKNVPFCLEANTPDALILMKRMVKEISSTAYEVSSDQRKKLHLAAVFVCNFVNHLYTIGEEICRDNELPFKILQPLIQETAEKIADASPYENQTGPAIRNDSTTIQSHLELITSPENKDIYSILTHAIQSAHGKKL